MLILMAVLATASAATKLTPSVTVAYDQFYVNLRGSLAGAPGVMSHTLTPTLRWGYSNFSDTSLNYAGYQVQVWEDGSGSTIVDTGAVQTSNQTLQITSVGLKFSTRYHWRVQVFVSDSTTEDIDRKPYATSWSENHTFFTALPESWNAKPIWAGASGIQADLPQYAFFRSHFDLDIDSQASLLSAMLYISANVPLDKGHEDRPPKILAAYKVWVSDNFVGIGPGRGRCGPSTPCFTGSPEQPYDGYDVTHLLSSADSVELFVSAYGLPSADIGNPKLLAQIVLRYSDGSSVVHGTGADTWYSADADRIYNPTGDSGCAWYFYPQENFNADELMSGTPLSVGKLIINPSDWQTAKIQDNFDVPLIPKPTAPINVTTVAAVLVESRGNNAFFFDMGREIQGGVTLTIALPRELAQAPPEDRTVVVTLAEELTGNQTIMFPPRTGTKPQVSWTLAATAYPQTISHHEYFEWRYGTLQFSGASTGNACGDHVREGSTATISCTPGTITGFSFASFGTSDGSCDQGGFKLNSSCNAPSIETALKQKCVGKTSCSLEVESDMAGADPCHRVPKWFSWNATCSQEPSPKHPIPITTDIFNVSAWVAKMEYHSSKAASMSSSNTALNAVWEMCRYTIESSSLDLYTDSNARQRSADCDADDVTAMQSQYATSDELSLQLYHTEQLFAMGPASRTDWAVLPIIAVRNHVLHTGDLQFAAAQFDNMLSNFSSIKLISNATGLVEGGSCLVDWPTGMQDHFVRSQTSTIASAWVYYGTVALADLAQWLGRASDEQSLKTIAANLKTAMNAKQFNGSAFCDGVCKNVSHTAFHSSFHPLAFGAVSDENMAATWEYVKCRINPPFSCSSSLNDSTTPRKVPWPPPEPNSGVGLPCGVHPAQFAVEALYANTEDRGHAALQVLVSTATNSWVSMLRQGATMTMEMWNAEEKPNLTWSHPWASSPAFLIAWYLFGIRPTSPGMSKLQIMPAVGDLEQGRYEMPTVRGRVSSSFSQSDGRFHLELKFPASIQADIKLPLPIDIEAGAVETASVSWNGAPPRVLAVKKGYVSFGTVNGGIHSFTVTL